MIGSGRLEMGRVGQRLLMTALLLAAAGRCFCADAAQFRASVVKIDITPDQPQWLLGYGPRQSTGVHDRIYHRIVAMDDGQTQFFLVSTDICLFSPSVYDEVMSALEAETGIKPVQVWWTVTHTHSAPEVGPPGLGAAFMGERYKHDHNTEYTARVKKSLIEGVKEARAKLEPARLGIGWGMAMANINRRARDLEGPTYLGLNPDGPADRQIGLIRLERADGKLLALIANYAMHGTALGPHNDLITGDAPGIVAEYVETETGRADALHQWGGRQPRADLHRLPGLRKRAPGPVPGHAGRQDHRRQRSDWPYDVDSAAGRRRADRRDASKGKPGMGARSGEIPSPNGCRGGRHPSSHSFPARK